MCSPRRLEYCTVAQFSALLQPDVVEPDVDVRLADEPQIEGDEEASQEVVEPTQEAEGNALLHQQS